MAKKTNILDFTPLTDTDARRIAADWAAGGDALQQLASTGTITANTYTLINTLVNEVTDVYLDDEARSLILIELFDLQDYCYDNGPTRGPQEGWSNLTW